MSEESIPPLGSRKNWNMDYVPRRRTLDAEESESAQPAWMSRALLLSAVLMLVLAGAGVYLKYRPLSFDPMRWQEADPRDRGRMLESLLGQTSFVGFTRDDVQLNIGRADFDERQFWYDLGPLEQDLVRESRARVGDSTHLYVVFSHSAGGIVSSVYYSYRRPTLGSAPFDSTVWFGDDPTARRGMMISTLGRVRQVGLNKAMIQNFLGPPDGWHVRAHYDVGFTGPIISRGRALVLWYDKNDVVTKSEVVQ